MGITTAVRMYLCALPAVAACFVAACSLAARLPAQVFQSLERTPFTPTTPTTAGLLLIDVDGDGDNDLLAGSPISFYENVGAGRFVLAATSPGGIAHRKSTVGDIDGDGDLDFCTATQVYRNVGGGTFVAEQVFALGFFSVQVPDFLDLDGDGDLDLLFTNPGGYLFLNDGTGFFVEAPIGALPGGTPDVNGVAILDADRDGDLDVAVLVGTVLFSIPRLWRNDGQGGLVEELLPGSVAFALFASISTADFNADGADDLIITLDVPAITTVCINNGAGQFSVVPTTGLPDALTLHGGAAWGDWSQDGRSELLGPSGYWQSDSSLNFTFVPWPERKLGNAGYVIAQDLDGDLDIDILVNGSPPLMVMNTSAGPVQAVSTSLPTAIGPNDLLDSVEFLDPRFFASVIPNTAILTLGSELSLISDVRTSNPTRLDRTFRPLTFSGASTTGVSDAALLFVDSYSTSWVPKLTVVSCGPSGVQLWFRHSGNMTGFVNPLPVGQPTHVAVADVLGSEVMELVFGDPLVEGPLVAVAGPFFPENFTLTTFSTFPPASPSKAPIRESVIAEDIDGDGDVDIVHELRLLRNDGNGVWTVAADFAAAVPPATDGMLSIDFDNDGDRDLLAFGEASPITLLRNDGSAFVDATFGHIPTAEIAPAADVTAGDVDADGDEDLLVRRNGTSNLLRNDGGVFTRIVGVGPAGRLVDANRDGHADLLTDNKILWNTFSHLHAPRLAAPGADWELQVRSWRQGAWPSLAFIAIGTEVVESSIPGFGTIHFAPMSADYFAVPLSLGQGTHTLPIPLSTTVLGVGLVAQAVVFDLQRGVLTGPVFDMVR